MEHVVFFPAPDGTPAFRRLASLDEAVRFVEHLRNVENVSEASVHALTEVPLSFKAWYRVELPTTSTAEVVESDTAALGPATIAEVIESYGQAPEPADAVSFAPVGGSATGIVVPDQPFVAVEQFGAAPVAVVAPQQGVPVEPAQPAAEAQVLEPAFGVPRERGIGFFAR